MDVPEHPLTDAHLGQLNAVMERAIKATKLLEHCASCDMPVDEPLAILNAQFDKARKLKSTFFPHHT